MDTKAPAPEVTSLIEKADEQVERLLEAIKAQKAGIETHGMTWALEWGSIERIVRQEMLINELNRLINILDNSKESYESIIAYRKKKATEKLMTRAWGNSTGLGHNISHMARHDATVEFINWLEENA